MSLVSAFASGTQTATINTEHFLSNVAFAFPLASSLTLGAVTIDFIPLFGGFFTFNF